MENKLAEGDQVILVDKCNKYTPTRDNPIWGSLVECIGTVKENKGYIKVYWHNGAINIYSKNDLEIYSALPDDNPNRTYRAKKVEARKSDEEMKFKKVGILHGKVNYAKLHFLGE